MADKFSSTIPPNALDCSIFIDADFLRELPKQAKVKNKMGKNARHITAYTGPSTKATTRPTAKVARVLIILENFSPMAPDIVEKYSPMRVGRDSTCCSSK
jgi:hypothetical protein